MDASKNIQFIHHTTSRANRAPQKKNSAAVFDNSTFRRDNSVAVGGGRPVRAEKKENLYRDLDRKIFEMGSLSEYNDGGFFG